jgi:hypothetical protein
MSETPKVTLTVTCQEFDTILAALRVYQQEYLDPWGVVMCDAGIDGIATLLGQHPALIYEEIDDLCEKINTQEQPRPILVYLEIEGGVLQTIASPHPERLEVVLVDRDDGVNVSEQGVENQSNDCLRDLIREAECENEREAEKENEEE